MATTLPSNPTKTNSDAVTDDPAQSILTDSANHIDATGNLLDALGAAAQLNITQGLGTAAQGAGTPDDLHVEFPVTGKTGAYTAVAGDRASVIRYTGAGGVTLSFTAAATLGDDWFCYVRNDSSGLITLDPNSSETIDGATTKPLEPGHGFLVVCNGSLFVTFGRLDVNALSTLSTVDGTNDLVPIYDATDGRLKGVAPDNLGGGSNEIVDTFDISSNTDVLPLTGMDSSAVVWVVEIAGLVVDTADTEIHLQVEIAGSPTFDTGSTSYQFAAGGNNVSAGAINYNDASEGHISLTDTAAGRAQGNAAGDSFSATIHIFNPASTSLRKKFKWETTYDRNGGGISQYTGGGEYISTTAILGIRIIPQAGALFTAGRATLYKRKHA
jgi:hypothetical protein